MGPGLAIFILCCGFAAGVVMTIFVRAAFDGQPAPTLPRPPAPPAPSPKTESFRPVFLVRGETLH